MSKAKENINKFNEDTYNVSNEEGYLGTFENKILFDDGSYIEYENLEESALASSPKITKFEKKDNQIMFTYNDIEYKLRGDTGELIRGVEGHFLFGMDENQAKEIEKNSGIDLELYRNSLGAPKQESGLKKIMRYKTGFRY